jgi:zinc protease
MVRGGSARDEARPGCASLAAGLLNKGSRRRSAEALALAVDELGAAYTATTGWDSTHVTLMGLSEDSVRLLELLAEIALQPAFAAEEFHLLRGRRLHSVRRSLDQPATLADWTFETRLFEDHCYGHPVGGTVRSLGRLTDADPPALHRQIFRPDQAVLALAGDLNPEETGARVETVFGGWTATGVPMTPPPGSPPEGKRRVIVVHRDDLSQAQIRWGHLGRCRADVDYDAVRVMNYILGGGGFASRLMQRIRSDRGLTYGIHSDYEGRVLPGPFVISTFTPSESVVEVLDEIEGLVEAYRQDGPSEAELEAARSRFVGGYPLQFETPAQVASRLLEVELYDLPSDSIETYQDRIDALGPEEVRRAARSSLHPERALIVVVGNIDRIGAALDRFGPVERFDARRAFGDPD